MSPKFNMKCYYLVDLIDMKEIDPDLDVKRLINLV